MTPPGRVLVVDDDPDIRYVARLALGRVGGWDVTLAGSGSEAFAHLATDHPDVILLDVLMPDMDGRAVKQALSERPTWADIPVVFMTAKVQAWEVDEYLNLGAAGVIHKPFDPMNLSELLHEILRDAGQA